MAGADRLRELAGRLGSRLIVPAGPVTVALSGGADSAALLWLLVDRGVDVEAVHVFHGLPASSLMSTAAGQVAAACGVRMRMVVVEPGGTGEHHLREARLRALLDASDPRPVLLAHTGDDQAETVLMRVLRGSGPAGIGGIKVSRGRVWHPMLEITRDEARELAVAAGLPFRDDPANADPGVLRNRLRHDVLPVVEAALGRSPRDALTRLAATADEESGVLERLADHVRLEVADGSVRLPLGAVRAVDPAIARRVVRRAVMAVTGSGYPPDRSAIARILQVVWGEVNAAEVGGGVRVVRHGPHLLLSRAGETPEVPPPAPLEDGAWSDWRFVVTVIEGPTVAPLSPRRLVAPIGPDRWEVRAHAEGDRVTGRRVSAALAEAGVPARDRAGWPVVCADGEPVWIPHVRARVWPVHASDRYLAVVAVREPTWETYEP
ncbi:MAG TPA: tRNA lysidine(34) synthetase TilS [Acidimicrobiia bacterium]|nr:tRNA lysidine(34) synthetase TilS [Acidimicrobiia bacterium]